MGLSLQLRYVGGLDLVLQMIKKNMFMVCGERILYYIQHGHGLMVINGNLVLIESVGWWFRSATYRVDTTRVPDTDKYIDFIYCCITWDGIICIDYAWSITDWFGVKK